MKTAPDETRFLFLGRLMVMCQRDLTTLTMGFPRYVAIRGRGGYRRMVWRLYWLVNDWREKNRTKHWWMIGNP